MSEAREKTRSARRESAFKYLTGASATYHRGPTGKELKRLCELLSADAGLVERDDGSLESLRPGVTGAVVSLLVRHLGIVMTGLSKLNSEGLVVEDVVEEFREGQLVRRSVRQKANPIARHSVVATRVIRDLLKDVERLNPDRSVTTAEQAIELLTRADEPDPEEGDDVDE